MFKEIFVKRFLYISVLLLSIPAFAAGNAGEVDFQELLNKYAVAYSAMDIKALEPMVTSELLEQLKEQFHEYRKAHQKPELTVVYSRQQDAATVVTAATLKVGGKDVYANQQTIYTLKDNRIAGVKRLEIQVPAVKLRQESFWDAVRASDTVGIINVENKAVEVAAPNGVTAAPPQPGATAAAGAIKILLTGEAVTGNEIELPKWAIYQLKPGRMLLPLKKSGSSYEAFGAGYEIPALPQGNEKLFADVFNQYKQLAPEKENDFLKNLLLDSKFKMLQFPALRKIIVAGEFSRKLNAAELEYWHKFYLTLGDDMALKSTLLNNLSSQNFDANSPLFLAALEDRQVSGIAGRLFMRQDKTVFTAKMMQFLEEPAKREIALRNAAALSGNPEFVAKAMKYFDPNDNKMFVIYVPLLTAKNNPAGKEFIIKFLEESDREKDFSARFMLMATIWRSNNSDYVNETKSFITAEENNTKLMKSPAYLFALGYLYRNNDLDGMKMLLKYLDSVKPGSREEMMLRNLISNLRIRVVSAPVAASGSAVAAPLKPEKIQRSATRITPVELLRRHLELTITNSENIQQNTTSNAKELLKK